MGVVLPSAGSSSSAASAAGEGSDTPVQRILCLCEQRESAELVQARLGDAAEVVPVCSPARAVTLLARGGYDGIYADAKYFAPAADATSLLHNVQILGAMPDGVVLLDRDNRVVWGNGRLRDWTGRESIIGENFYSLLGGPEILGPDLQPFDDAFCQDRATVTTLRCENNRYYRVHVAPARHFDGERSEHVVVTIRDETVEQLQQQKLEAIHKAGAELADLTAEEVAELDVEERIELLKENIVRGTKDVLQFDVVEVRLLDKESLELIPLLAAGIKPEAERRSLRAATSGNGVTGFVAATGKAYLCPDTADDPLYIEGAQGARSSLTVPLLMHDEVIGTFNLESIEPNAFDSGDLAFAEVFARNVAFALNTMQLLQAEKATTAAASVEAIHSAVALPMDDILNDAVNVMERYIGHDPDVVERLQRILRNARDIKQVIQDVGNTLAPVEARPACVRPDVRPLLLGTRVLVADADGAVRGAAHDLLERYGCVVETAHDGREALAMVRNLGSGQSYGAIITDIRLPDYSGYELLLKLQEMMPSPPLVLMTGFGYDPGHTIVKARQAGLKAVLYKPFRLDQLLETVEQIVGGIAKT
jgi:CheY-like chemotaxis protein